ncbi:hypothetical protein GPJ56_006274 [Histomonas meleagridis]|uniref:uncharacterized protein n=1 Tax=Histomonas meleagridis TaxID=135588 RepID=UPI00355A783F|nr:hypothetical protein GPJ56_006274 [Histomonas meleagridis]KAH0796910.1 hypothetical protein GO595_010803 [Histomonas meleagridis]
MLVLFTSQDESVQAIFYTFVFPIVVVIIDELILTRHHFSRKGFRAIEKPGDITWNIETQHSETIRLLNSEEEESFQSNLKSDIITSFFAFFVFFIAIIMRRLIVPNDFFVAPT